MYTCLAPVRAGEAKVGEVASDSQIVNAKKQQVITRPAYEANSFRPN
jgi:hypothetical protein